MDDGRPLHERVDALERAVTDGHADDGLPDAARTAARVDALESTVEEMDDRLAELEAAVQALRGFVGGVDAVDEAVERRANAAIARVDRLEAELERTGTEASGNRGAETDRLDAGIDDAGNDPNRPDTGNDPNRPDTGNDPTSPDTGTDHADRSSGEPVTPGADDPTQRIGGTDGTGARAETLPEAVAARSDAALAEAAARSDRSDRESTDGVSLADRLRRLL